MHEYKNGVIVGEIGTFTTEKTVSLGPTPVPRSHYFWAAVMGAFVVAAAGVPTIGYMLWAVAYGAP